MNILGFTLDNLSNIPLKSLKKSLSKIPGNKEIVAYCRGSHCVLAFDAVAMLRKKGFKARRFEKGFPEWKKAGLPVETKGNKTGFSR